MLYTMLLGPAKSSIRWPPYVPPYIAVLNTLDEAGRNHRLRYALGGRVVCGPAVLCGCRKMFAP